MVWSHPIPVCYTLAPDELVSPTPPPQSVSPTGQPARRPVRQPAKLSAKQSNEPPLRVIPAHGRKPRMRRTIMKMGPLCLLLLLASAGAAFSGDEREPPVQPARRITVTLSEYQFTPSKIDLKAGELVELTLINKGTVTHEFITLALSNLEVAVTIAGVETETVGVAELELAPKATAVLRFTPETAGTYPFFCGAKQPTDHRAAGMTGVLIIE